MVTFRSFLFSRTETLGGVTALTLGSLKLYFVSFFSFAMFTAIGLFAALGQKKCFKPTIE